MTPRSGSFRGGIVRELLVALGFLLLTAAMTWPWITHLRDAAADRGDPYLNSWILWWDYHQTFHDPLHLFDGNIFYPLRYSLAFSEHNYGLALPLFPLFGLGLRPLTATSLLTFLAFAFSGYGAFRLARTLTGSTAAGWIAGVGFAFSPYRFHQLSHVNYAFAGWIPLLLEAAVLFARERSRRRAAWLGVAFLMNGLTCIHWLVLSAIPFALVTAYQVTRERAWRDPALRRGLLAVGAASLALGPFLVPYRTAATLYRFERSRGDALEFSATPSDWLSVDPRNKLWSGLGAPINWERPLFPGLLLLLLPAAALLLVERELPQPAARASPRAVSPPALRWLDGIAFVAGGVALASSVRPLRISVLGHELLKASDPSRALVVLTAALAVRCALAWPRPLGIARQPHLLASLRAIRRPDALVIGVLLAVTGVLGSFGVRFPFHRALFETFSIFRSIRVPARWGMVGHLGLALLAALGVMRLAERLGARVARVLPAVAVAALLFELRSAPLGDWVIRGAVDADDVTRALARTPMRGGIVEFPSGGSRGNYEYVLRAADHGKPLINAVSGFNVPIVAKLESLAAARPIGDALLDHLESIPASYVVVHESLLDPWDRPAWHQFLARALETGRLRFVGRFDAAKGNDLYAVAKNEPGATSAGAPAWFGVRNGGSDGEVPPPPGREDPNLTGWLDSLPPDNVVHGEMVVRGWCQQAPDRVCPGVMVFIDDRLVPAAATRVPRADVCEAISSMTNCDRAGFAVPVGRLAPGEHTLSAVIVSESATWRRVGPWPFRWAP